LFKQNWFGIDDFLLNHFTTFASVLGLQVTVGLQVNIGLQPLTRWEQFVVGTMLRPSKPTIERVEPTILSLIAVDITHFTRLAFLLLLRIQRYM